MLDTAAIVVTWNRKNLLRQCIEHLLAQKNASCDILVVDNASTDGTKEMIDEEFTLPNVKYLNTGSNLGGAGGFQVGIKWAAREGYDYIWIMDDDSLPNEDALRELLEAGNRVDGTWGFLSSAVYWTDGSICKANRPKRNVFSHLRSKDYHGLGARIQFGTFVSMLVPSSVVYEVGLPLSEYFIWTDDYEFSGRISKLYPCYFVPSSKIIHAMSENTSARLATADGARFERFHFLYRNDVHCYRQHGLMGHLYLVAKFLYTSLDVLLHSKENRMARIQTMQKGYMEGFKFNPQIKMMLKGRISELDSSVLTRNTR